MANTTNSKITGVYNGPPIPASGDTTGQQDVVAIQNQLDNLGSVQLGPGTFYVNTAIRITSNQHLSGSGMGRTIIKMVDKALLAASAWNGSIYTSLANVIFVGPASGSSTSDVVSWSVQDLTLDGNRAGQTDNGSADNALNCLCARNDSGYKTAEFLIKNVEAKNAGFHGIALYDCVVEFAIESCYLHDNGFRGAHLHGSDAATSTGGTFSFNNNRVYKNGQATTWTAQIAAGGMNTGLFVCLNNVHYGSVYGNQIWAELGVGIDISGIDGAGATVQADMLTFANNSIYDCGRGVNFGGGAKNITFTGNNIASCTTTSKASGADGYGINLQSGSVALENLNISDNTIKLCVRGTQFNSAGTYGGTQIKFKGNTITGCTQSGFSSSDNTAKWTYCTIADNNIYGNNTSASTSYNGILINGFKYSRISGNLATNNGDASVLTSNLKVRASSFCHFVENMFDGQAASAATVDIDNTNDSILFGVNYVRRASGGAAVIFGATNSIAVSNQATAFTSVDAGAVNGKFNVAGTTAAQTATLTNGPVAGNPNAWIPFKDATNTTRYFPVW